jgi:hypothetical protein
VNSPVAVWPGFAVSVKPAPWIVTSCSTTPVLFSVKVTFWPSGTCTLVGLNLNSEAVIATLVGRFVGAAARRCAGELALVCVERLMEPRIIGLNAIAVTTTLSAAINRWD